MHTAKLRMRPFAAIMMTARRWLDAHGVMPSVFHYDTGGEKMLVVRIQFTVDEEAEVFAGVFYGAGAGAMSACRVEEQPR